MLYKIFIFLKSLSQLLGRKEYIKVYFYNWWYDNPVKFESIWFFKFLQHIAIKKVKLNCIIQDISFYSVLGDNKILNNGQKKCFFTGENLYSPKNRSYGEYRDINNDMFDLSMGFERLSGDNYIRFPLWLLYFFPPDSSKDDISFIVKKFNSRVFSKTHFCCLVASHDYIGIRENIYRSLIRLGRVDSAGKFLHNDDSLKNQFGDNKRMYLERYRFNICPENSLGDGYITEKLFESLWSGCIPIYWGASDLEPGVINPEWVIMWNYSDNNDKNIELISKLNTDVGFYNEFTSKPKLLDSSVDVIWNAFEELKSNLLELI